MSNHTAGPWSWSPDKWNGGFSGLFAESGQAVVVPQHRNDGDDGAAWFDEISPADAGLIAAAPCMCSALESIAEYWNGDANEMAMKDALDYIVNLAQTTLEKARREKNV